MWKYTKVKTEEGGYIYDSICTINELGLGEAEIVDYAYDGDDIYEEMIVIERAIHSFFEKGGN